MVLPDSPLNFEVRVEVDTLKNEVLHSVATAFASIVFPVPDKACKLFNRAFFDICSIGAD